jgi:hypothetical protein
VIFIAGNLPLISEIVPLLIISKLEQYDVLGATALAVVMLGALLHPAAGGQPAAMVDGESPQERRAA